MTSTAPSRSSASHVDKPRFGGIFWRVVGVSNPLMVKFAGSRWNPIFSVVQHVGRKSGRPYSAPVGARRVANGFVISLAFGPQVDWYRNLVAADGGTIRWRDRSYPVGRPEKIDREMGIAAFNLVQRFFLRLTGVDNYIRVADRETALA